ncbi:MAG: type II toxin-antitoxin system VapC family toxin [Pseudomonadota bacterium]
MTAPRFLLDTHILSDLVRHPQGAIAQGITRVGENAVCTSMIVACELRFGAAKKGSERLIAQVDTILSAMDVLPFDAPADDEYGKLRLHLERAGTPIGPNDMLIAAHALATQTVLVTANVSEFSRVPGLKVENWL